MNQKHCCADELGKIGVNWIRGKHADKRSAI